MMIATTRQAVSVAFVIALTAFGASAAARPIDDWLGCWPCDVTSTCRRPPTAHPLRDDGWYATKAAALRFHLPEIDGNASPALIAHILKRGDFVHCLVPQNHTPAGSIALGFLVDASGSVVTATATGVDRDLATCIAGVVATLRFPARRGGEIMVRASINIPAIP